MPSSTVLLIEVVVLAGLGGTGIYLLLPKPRHHSVLAGGVLALLALLILGVLLSPVEPSAETFLFFVFSAVAVISGCLLITQRNPARAALSFALVVVSTCGLFLLQAAPFLMAATIIIYAGAIIVTFLFVLMLAQQEGPSDADARSREPLWSACAGAALLGTLLFVLGQTYRPGYLPELDQHLARIDRVARLSDPSEAHGETDPLLSQIKDALDDFQKWRNAHVPSPEDPTPARVALLPEGGKPLADRLGEAQQVVREQPVRWDRLHDALVAVHNTGLAVRNSLGSLQVPASVTLPGQAEPVRLSAYSGPAANLPPESLRRDAQGRPQLPAENAGYLGRSLFTDYLLPVELGGTLLLVATIGAIAIATRRAERLP